MPSDSCSKIDPATKQECGLPTSEQPSIQPGPWVLVLDSLAVPVLRWRGRLVDWVEKLEVLSCADVKEGAARQHPGDPGWPSRRLPFHHRAGGCSVKVTREPDPRLRWLK